MTSIFIRSIMENVKEYFVNNSTIRIVFGDIMASNAEVIVSSDDTRITMSGGVSRSILMAEGTGVIKNDAHKNIPAEVGDVVVTTAGTLLQKYIFHVITMNYDSYEDRTGMFTKDDMHQYIINNSIDKCFSLLHALDLKSIAFPSIGAGTAAIPFVKVATAMAEAIVRNLKKTNKAFVVELYLKDKFERMSQWDFLSMFEQFAAQVAMAGMKQGDVRNGLVPEVLQYGNSATGGKLSEQKDIFISYSRKDTETVKDIYNWLEGKGYKCWIDLEGMSSSDSYKAIIVDAIKNSKILMFMSSENSNSSQNVVSEVSLAMKYGKKIIPVKLDEVPYTPSIEYDIVNIDFVNYYNSDHDFAKNMILKKIAYMIEVS